MAENTENKYLNKVPPHDNDAEQAVLACMLLIMKVQELL